MNKRKILTLAMTLAMVAILAIGGTLAYFTDTDSATNTFTVGNVKIKLIEQQRDGKGGLEDFEDGKTLNPIVGSAQGEKDKYGLSTAKNYVDKIVTVKNLANDAYVRVYVAVPTKLQGATAASNVLHWNVGNKFVAAGNKTDMNADVADYATYMGPWTEIGTTTIDGVQYDVGYYTYKKMLTKDQVTGSAFIVGCYLDSNVNYNATTGKYTMNNTTIDFDFSKGVKIPVVAIGAQADGFTDADVALNTAFGANYSPWTLD